MNQDVSGASAAATAGNRAKVFVSYSRKDLAFAQTMVEALAERGFDAFLDKKDIAPGEPWRERLAGLDRLRRHRRLQCEPGCGRIADLRLGAGLEHAPRKRIIPVVARRIPDADAPPALGGLNWVFLTESDDKAGALAALDKALHTHSPGCASIPVWASWRVTGTSRGAATARPCAARIRSRRTLARPPTNRRERANRPAPGFHPGKPAGGDRTPTLWVGGSLTVAVVAIALAVFAESAAEAQTQRERAEHTLTLATGTATASCSTSRKSSAMSSVCRPQRSRTFSIGPSAADPTRRIGRPIKNCAVVRRKRWGNIRTLLALGDTQGALAAAGRRNKSSRLWRRNNRIAWTFSAIVGERLRGRRRAGGAGRSGGRAGFLSGAPCDIGTLGEVRSRQRRVAARRGIVANEDRRRAGGAGQFIGRA